MRVAFICTSFGTGWIGGSNYYRNLMRSLVAEPVGVEPVLFLPTGPEPILPEDFPPIEVIRTKLLERWSLPWWSRTMMRKIARRDLPMEKLLKQCSVDVLSHSAPLGVRSSVPTISWIPDFQHLRLPDFFTPRQRTSRDKYYASVMRKSDLVIVSSNSALSDLASFFPEGVAKARVLRFMDCSTHETTGIGFAELRKKYELPPRYLLLPNQFWAHKNHLTVIRALGILRKQGKDVLIVTTGSTHDYRRPQFFDELMRERKMNGVEAQFRVLGVVPYPDLVGLMRHALAIVNPSLLEGWSTTVEEAKSLGKRLVLSAIDVHKEQAAERATFFEPHDAEGLAHALWSTWLSDYREDEERLAQEKAVGDILRRRHEFASSFASIVHEAVHR